MSLGDSETKKCIISKYVFKKDNLNVATTTYAKKNKN